MSVSYVGTWMQRLVQDWLALTLPGGGAHAVGVATALQLLPYVVLSLTAGRIADRYSPSLIVLLGNLGGLVVSVGLLAMTAFDSLTLPLLYVFAATLGVLTALESPSRTRLLSDLVPRSAISSSVSWRNISYEGAHLAGLPLAGLILAHGGPPWVLAINALSYLPLVFRAQQLRLAKPTPSIRERVRPHLRDALRLVLSSRLLTNALLVALVLSLFSANFQVLLAVTVVTRFNGGADLLGWLAAAPAAGALLGSTTTTSRRVLRVRWVVAAALLSAGTVMALSAASHLLLFGGLLLIGGAATAVAMNVTNALLLGNPDTSMRGRLAAIAKLVTTTGSAGGAYLAGLLGGHFGPTTGLAILGGLTVVGLAVHGVAYVLAVRPGRRPAPG